MVMHVYDTEREELDGYDMGIHRVLTPIAYLLDSVPTDILSDFFDFPWDVAAFMKVQAQALMDLPSHTSNPAIQAEFDDLVESYYDEQDWYAFGADIAEIARLIRIGESQYDVLEEAAE